MKTFFACLAFLAAVPILTGCGKSASTEESTPEWEEAQRKAKEILEKKDRPGAQKGAASEKLGTSVIV
jgi:hypothetical protein